MSALKYMRNSKNVVFEILMKTLFAHAARFSRPGYSDTDDRSTLEEADVFANMEKWAHSLFFRNHTGDFLSPRDSGFSTSYPETKYL